MWLTDEVPEAAGVLGGEVEHHDCHGGDDGRAHVLAHRGAAREREGVGAGANRVLDAARVQVLADAHGIARETFEST